MKTLVLRHLQVFFDTLGSMGRTPGPTLVTVVVLGVAISLPIVLFKISDSLVGVTGQWQGDHEITLFLKTPEALDGWAEEREVIVEFAYKLLQIPRINDVQYVSKEQALAEFKTTSGFGDLLNDLAENPLPPMLIVFPEPLLSATELKQLVKQLNDMPQVEMISYDQEWRERLSAIIDLLEYTVIILACLMGIGVVLIISNTVRLSILDRSDEIEIIDQIGGTASFIRRPFLYYGAIQGMIGALVALGIANATLFLLSQPVNRLAELYHSNIKIGWIDATLWGSVILIVALLGWLTARYTVGNYIRNIRANARGK